MKTGRGKENGDKGNRKIAAHQKAVRPVLTSEMMPAFWMEATGRQPR